MNDCTKVPVFATGHTKSIKDHRAVWFQITWIVRLVFDSLSNLCLYDRIDFSNRKRRVALVCTSFMNCPLVYSA